MLDGEWLSYPEAAKRLEISEDAIRQNVRADRMHERRGLDGRPVVWVGRNGATASAPGAMRPKDGNGRDETGPLAPADPAISTAEPAAAAAEPETGTAARTEADPSVTAAIAALQTAFRDDLARVESRYQEEIARLQDLHRTQVGLLLERVDAAEIRAESLQDVVDKLTQTVPQIEALAGHTPDALAEAVAARLSELLPDPDSVRAAQEQMQALLARFAEQVETQQQSLGNASQLGDQLQGLIDRLGDRKQRVSASSEELGTIDRRIAALTDRLSESLADDHRRGPPATDILQKLEAALASVSERLFAQDTQMSDFSALVNRLEKLGGSLDDAARARQAESGAAAAPGVSPEMVAPIKDAVEQILATLGEQQSRLDQTQGLGQTLTSLVEDVRSQRAAYETANQNVQAMAKDLNALKEQMGGRLADQTEALQAVQALKDQYQALTESLTRKPESPEVAAQPEPPEAGTQDASAQGSAFPMMFPPFWFMLGR